MKNTLFLLLTIGCMQAAAQEDGRMTINSITRDSTALNRSVYHYPKWVPAHILFNDDKVATARVNLNRITGNFLFINAGGDSLEFAAPQDIKYIAAAGDTFVYAKQSFLQKLTHYPGVNLYKRSLIKFTGKEKKGAYGVYSGTSASTSIDKVEGQYQQERIGVDANDVYAGITDFFLSENGRQYLPASKKNIRKLFSEKEGLLDKYIENNKINYGQQEPLTRLLQYLQ